MLISALQQSDSVMHIYVCVYIVCVYTYTFIYLILFFFGYTVQHVELVP